MRPRLQAVAIFFLAVAAGCGGRKAKLGQTPRIGARQTGEASWYGHPYHGRRTASGEVYDMEKLTAAHRTLAFQTWVRVENLSNGKIVDVKINDRGPFAHGRIIDLSRAAARSIDMIGPGVAKIRLEVIPRPARQPVTPASSAGTSPDPPPTPGPAPVAARFAVQAGAFRDRNNAEVLRNLYEARFGVARLVARDGEVTLWRVLVGEVATEEEAAQLIALLRAEGIEGFVTRID